MWNIKKPIVFRFFHRRYRSKTSISFFSAGRFTSTQIPSPGKLVVSFPSFQIDYSSRNRSRTHFWRCLLSSYNRMSHLCTYIYFSPNKSSAWIPIARWNRRLVDDDIVFAKTFPAITSSQKRIRIFTGLDVHCALGSDQRVPNYRPTTTSHWPTGVSIEKHTMHTSVLIPSW